MARSTSVELLFKELESIDWQKNPHRGLLTELGKAEYPNSQNGRIYVRNRIFKSRNLVLAVKLKKMVLKNESKAKEVLS